MESTRSQSIDVENIKPSFSLGGFAVVMLAAFIGAVTAAILLPKWIPGLAQSVTGVKPKVFWYLSRGSAFIAYFLLWLSMMFGTGITNKLSARWPGLPSTTELHQYTSILGLFFGFFHGMILMADQYMHFSLAQVLLPFSTTTYRPFAVGIGQLSFYIMLMVTLSFYVRKKMGYKTWRALHFFSFASYTLTLIHGITAGTDSSTIVAQYVYLITGALLLFMISYRILVTRANSKEKKLRLQGIPPRIPNI
jgi:predicted ferric reductase